MSAEDISLSSEAIKAALYGYCFSENGIDLIIKVKDVDIDIDVCGDIKTNIIYQCNIISNDVQIAKTPFYLCLTGHADCYDKSEIGYLEVVYNPQYNPDTVSIVRIYIKSNIQMENILKQSIGDGFNKIRIYLNKHVRPDDTDPEYSISNYYADKLPVYMCEVHYTKKYYDLK